MGRMGLDINPQVDMNINGGVTDLYNYLKDYTTVVLQPNRVGNRNILTQEMVAGENIKYIIKYNYNLDGKNIVFNANTIIEIDGGSLTNGGIVGNNTFLINRNELPEEEILINVVKSGTWRSTTTDEIQAVTKHRVYLTSDGNGILTQDMINKPNTIYVIKDDLVLGGDITIPANCVLEFDGGSFDGNHVITGSKIPTNKIYTPEMFGAGKNSDDTKAIQSALNLCKYVRMDGSYNVYSSDDSQNVNPALWVKSDTDIELNGSIHLKSTTFTDYSVLFLKDVDGIRIHGRGKIEGDKLIHTATASEHGSCIGIYRSSNIVIDGIELYNANGDGIYFSWWETKSSNVLIQNVYIHDVRRHGIAPLGNNITIKNFRIENCFGATAQSDCGIDVENDVGSSMGDILIDTGIIKNCKLGIATGGGQEINNVLIKNVKCIKDEYPSPIIINQYCVIEDCEAESIGAYCDCLIKNSTVNNITELAKNAPVNPTIIDNCIINNSFKSDSNSESSGTIIIRNCILNMDCTSDFNLRNSGNSCQFKFYNCTLNISGSYTGNFNNSELNNCTVNFTNIMDCGFTANNSYFKIGLIEDNYGVVLARTQMNLNSCTLELGERNTPLWRLDYGAIKALNCCIIDPITGRQRSVYTDYTLTEAGNTYIENNQVVQ